MAPSPPSRASKVETVKRSSQLGVLNAFSRAFSPHREALTPEELELDALLFDTRVRNELAIEMVADESDMAGKIRFFHAVSEVLSERDKIGVRVSTCIQSCSH
jgi:hypothetical protein